MTKTPYIANVFVDGFSADLCYKGGAAIESQIRRVAAVGKALERETHKVAVSCLYHAEQEGDFTKLSKLVNSLRNGRDVKNGSLRLQGLILWISTYSPAKWDVKGTQFKKNKADDAVPFDVASAAAIPYWELSQENVPEAITLKDVYVMLSAMSKKALAMTKSTEKRESLIEGDQQAVARVTKLASVLETLAEPFKDDAEIEEEIEEEIEADKAVLRIFANNAAKAEKAPKAPKVPKGEPETVSEPETFPAIVE